MAIAFKEWALICEALGSGHQSVILRKGGIAEGRNGFGFEHREFYLFPTWFHGQVQKVKHEYLSLSEQVPDPIPLNYTAVIEWSGRVADKEAVHRLSELHVLDSSVIEERFDYDTGKESGNPNGIHVALVRVYRLEPPISLPMEKRFGGCRSWVELPEIDAGALVSVLSDEEHERRKSRFAELLGISLEESTGESVGV